jgi:hypothetical protein
MKRNKLTFGFLAFLCALDDGKERTMQLSCEFRKVAKRDINI